jgi:hypothetical protein
MRKLVLKSGGKLIWGARKVDRAALAMMPPKISPIPLPMRGRIAHAGDCTQRMG